MTSFSTRFTHRGPTVLLGALIAGYIGAVGRYLVGAHQAFYTFYDLAIYDQLFWNTLHGRFFITSLDAIHFSLGIHFSPIMLIYLPLYAIRPSPTTLLVARTMLLAPVSYTHLRAHET